MHRTEFLTPARRVAGFLGLVALLFVGAGRADGLDNDTCLTAEDAGSAAVGTRLEGALSGLTGDVDFYRLSVKPRGFFDLRVKAGSEPLDMMLAVFTGDCESLLYFNDDLSAASFDPGMKIRAPADGVIIVAVSGFPDIDFLGDHSQTGSYTLRFRKAKGLVMSNVELCDEAPTDGGQCAMSARLDNRGSEGFSGEAWYIVFANGLEPPFGFSTRQYDPPKGQVELEANDFTKLNVSFKINARAPVGAEYCAELFVGSGDLLFNVQSIALLGCVVKGDDAPAFGLGTLETSRVPSRAALRRMKRGPVTD